MKNTETISELNVEEITNIYGGNKGAEAMGEACGHFVGSAIKMFLFCAAVQSGFAMLS